MPHLKLSLVVVGLFAGLYTYGQQLHFSDYDQAPHIMSPAMAGAFHGTYRIGTTLREQYRKFIFDPYKSTNVYVDTPQAFGLSDRDWFGVSMSFTKTEAGSLGLQETRVIPGLAYHKSLGRKGKSVIGLGVQYALASRQLSDASAFKSEDELLGQTQSSQDRSLVENYNGAYSSLNVGLYFRSKVNKKSELESGIAVSNILDPSFTTSENNYTNTAGRSFLLHSQLWIRSKKLTVNPSLVFQTRHQITNLMSRIRMDHLLNKKNNLRFNYSLGVRLNDALLFGAGAQYKTWSFAINYDMTLSSAKAYNGMNGAMEIGVHKIIVIYPKPKKKIIQICPRL